MHALQCSSTRSAKVSQGQISQIVGQTSPASIFKSVCSALCLSDGVSSQDEDSLRFLLLVFFFFNLVLPFKIPLVLNFLKLRWNLRSNIYFFLSQCALRKNIRLPQKFKNIKPGMIHLYKRERGTVLPGCTKHWFSSPVSQM